MRYIAMLMVLVATGMSDAVAQKTEPLQIKLVRSKVVLETGQEGVEDVATYTNISQGTLRNLVATLPVPKYTELVVASVRPANAKASIDGKNFFNVPLVRKQVQANGVKVEQLVPLNEYRYLRWYPGELAPDKPLDFSARFKVSVPDSQGVKPEKVLADLLGVFALGYGLAEGAKTRNQPVSAPTLVNCTSTRVGDRVNTTCF